MQPGMLARNRVVGTSAGTLWSARRSRQVHFSSLSSRRFMSASIFGVVQVLVTLCSGLLGEVRAVAGMQAANGASSTQHAFTTCFARVGLIMSLSTKRVQWAFAGLAVAWSAGCSSTRTADEYIRLAGTGALPRSYVCCATKSAPTIDGKLDDPVWQSAPWSEDFVDIEGDKRPKPAFRTHAKLLWSQEALFIAAELEEPHIRGTLKLRDAIVFHDPDFEVFIDPNGDSRNYFEIEVNALGTIFDLLLKRTYRDGGPAIHAWNVEGLRVVTYVDGSLNHPADTDRGWSVEMAIPWKALANLARTPCPPREHDVWRFGFSRVEWPTRVIDGYYETPEGSREDNWVWSPQGVIDMHRPERWGYVVFVAAAMASEPPTGVGGDARSRR